MSELAKWFMAAGGGAILATIVQAVINRRKLGAETDAAEANTASVLSKTALELLQPLREQVADLTRQLAEATAQLDRVKAKAEHLEQDLDACRASNHAKDEQIYALRRTRASNDKEHQ